MLFRSIARFLLLFTLALIVFLESAVKYQAIRSYENPSHYLSLKRADVFVANPPQWVDTVKQTTLFLKKVLTQDETFFALPYDPIYYFLAGKDSPTRQLIFFDHINIRPEQEKEIIGELEKKKVNFIVLSSRCRNTHEEGLGTFGKTYGLLLSRYLDEKFKAVAVFGNWEDEPAWAWNHGTKIFKRIKPLVH